MTRADFETIRLEVEDGVALLTLNRPEKMNAFNGRMMDELIAALDVTDRDDDVRALIVTGEGRAFCAGADLSGGANAFNYDAQAESGADAADMISSGERDSGGRVALRIYESLKPVIAAINGAAVGVGATMTLPMDIRIASNNARFGFVFARRGIVPDAASAYFLPRVTSISTALEWSMSGRLVPADEALQRGLLRSVHAPEDLLPAARAIARDIADNSAPVSVALTRRMMWEGLGFTHPMQMHRLDSRLIIQRGQSSDAAEGVSSFLEKRSAVYTDKVSTDMPQPFPWSPALSFKD